MQEFQHSNWLRTPQLTPDLKLSANCWNYIARALTSNEMVFIVQFGINKHSWIFWSLQIALALRGRAIVFSLRNLGLFIPNWIRNNLITYTNWTEIALVARLLEALCWKTKRQTALCPKNKLFEKPVNAIPGFKLPEVTIFLVWKCFWPLPLKTEGKRNPQRKVH